MATLKKGSIKADPTKDKIVAKVVKTVVPETVEPSPETRNIQSGEVVGTPVQVYEHIVTKEDLTENPNLVDDGVKEGDVVEIPVTDAALEGQTPAPESNAKPVADEVTAALMAKMQPYIKAYPENKAFHITTDGQVFLDVNKGDAVLHQRTLNGELVTFSAIPTAPERV
jgi:O-phosphoseryl-tRNA(Cys) synthetase